MKLRSLLIPLLAALLLGCSGTGVKTVGKQVPASAVTEFYWTYDHLEYPASYLRYRLFTEDGAYYFFYDKREKQGYGPTTEADRTACGTVALTETQWQQALQLFDGGTVQARTESVTTGGSGPWQYLYWNGDRGKEQVFTFADAAAAAAFTALCEEWMAADAPAQPVSAACVLTFSSFAGGGPAYTLLPEDDSLFTWTERRDHGADAEQEDGAPFDVIFTLTGLHPGETLLTVQERSPIAGNYDHSYRVIVDESLAVQTEYQGTVDLDADVTEEKEEEPAMLAIETERGTLYARLEDNSSARALADRLQKEPITLTLDDYGNFEKVGALPWSLPTNDERITTRPGDVILYQGDHITIYYDRNTWSFTRLAVIEDATREGLLDLLGSGSVTVTLSLD